MKRAIQKLSGRAGESLGETLFALLISALALMMLAGAVSAGMRMVTSSKKAVDDYYQVNNAIVARSSASLSNLRENLGSYSGAMTIVISNPSTSTTVTSTSVSYWKNEQMGATPVVTYTMPKS